MNLISQRQISFVLGIIRSMIVAKVWNACREKKKWRDSIIERSV